MNIQLVCVDCEKSYEGIQLRYRCDCGGTLDVVHDLATIGQRYDRDLFDQRLSSKHPADRSGVWRFRELILPVEADQAVTRGEGNTHLYDVPSVAEYCGVERLRLKHEGENPTGSFKDRGMTVGTTVARLLDIDLSKAGQRALKEHYRLRDQMPSKRALLDVPGFDKVIDQIAKYVENSRN